MNKKIDVFKIMTVILLILNILFLFLLFILNILPIRFFIFVLVFMLVINGILFGLAFVKKIKNPQVNLFLSIIVGILSGLLLIVSFYLYRMINFMDNFGDNSYKTENYSVVVLKNSEFEKLTDLKNMSIGYFDSGHEGLSLALEEMKEQLIAEYKSLESVDSLYNSLLTKDIDSLLIEDSYIEMLKELDETFNDKTTVIYSFSIKIKVEDISKTVDVTKEPFAIYVSGIDTYGNISSVSRSDVNIVAVVNPKTYQILLISIPRDYYVKLHDTTGYKDKLTHAGMYGVEMSVQTIEDLLGLTINYYFKVNFTSLIDIIDALGGVDVYSEYSFDSEVGYYFYKGYNKMNGEQALAFARTRHAFIDGDRQRGKNQQAVIEAVIRKVASKAIIAKYDSLLDAVSGKFQTNLETSEITSLAKLQLDKMPSWTVKSISLNGFDSSNYTYTYSSGKLYVMEPDQKSIDSAKEFISQILGGQKLESSYGEVSNIKNPEIVNPIPEQSTNDSDVIDDSNFDFSLNSSDITLKIGENTNLIVNNSKGDIVSWKSSNPDVATVSSDGLITPFSEGITTITASISGKTVSCIVRVTNPLDTILPEEDNDGSNSNKLDDEQELNINGSDENNNEDLIEDDKNENE